MAKYKNPWHDGINSGPAYFETDIKPIKYRDFLIYHRIAYDVVKDGVCLTQMAGLSGAKSRIDLFAGKRPKKDTAERFWYDRASAYLPNGFSNLQQPI